MSRIIDSLTQEEWDNLPNWKKYVSNNSRLIVCITIILFVGLVVIIYKIK